MVVGAVQTEQARNRRSNVLLEFNGEKLPIAEWAERLGLKRKALEKRLNKHGWSVERALTAPIEPRRPRRLRSIACQA